MDASLRLRDTFSFPSARGFDCHTLAGHAKTQGHIRRFEVLPLLLPLHIHIANDFFECQFFQRCIASANSAVMSGRLGSIMSDCSSKHTEWVEITSADACSASRKPTISNPKRFDRLVKGLENPASKFPQIVLCVGETSMQNFASCLLPERDSSRQSSTRSRTSRPSSLQSLQGGLSSIHVGRSQAESSTPVFIADYHLNATTSRAHRCNCHDVARHEVVWADQEHSINDALSRRLIFPFSDLIYLFADDLGGVSEVINRIESWSIEAPATDLPRTALPRVCIVTFSPRTAASQLQAEAFDARLKTIRYHSHFSNVQLLRFDAMDPLKHDRDVRRATMDELKIVNDAKQEAKVRFNAVHMAEFFSQATAHFARATGESFSFIRACRQYRPVPTAYREQIHTLLTAPGIHPDTSNRLIASCFLLDAYPPSSHGDYRSYCKTLMEFC